MKNAEKIKRAFDALQPSRDFSMEVEEMTAKKRPLSKALASVCVAAALVIAGATAAYAADLAGFRQALSLWIQGEQRNGVMEQVGEGEFVFIDEDGRENIYRGTIDDGSGERPMTMDEMLHNEEMEAHPFFEEKENGSVWMYYKEQKVDITEQFENGNTAFVTLDDGGKTLYFTVRWEEDGSFGANVSPSGFLRETN